MRAATVYFMGTAEVEPGWTPGDGTLNLARIIDRETGAAKLLDAWRELLAFCEAEDCDPYCCGVYLSRIADRARAAIAQASKTQ